MGSQALFVQLGCRSVIHELSPIAKCLFLSCSCLLQHEGRFTCSRGRSIALSIHQNKKKTVSSYRISRTVVFCLSKCDSPGCWSFFRQKRQNPTSSVIPCSLQHSQNKLYQNDKCHRPWSSQVISSALTSCYKVFMTFFCKYWDCLPLLVVCNLGQDSEKERGHIWAVSKQAHIHNSCSIEKIFELFIGVTFCHIHTDV